MTTCKKATELIVKSSEIKLSFNQKLNLKFHLLFCKACKLFKIHNDIIDNCILNNDNLKEKSKLSDTKKEELEQLLNNELKK